MAVATGTRFDRYQIISPIGSGGMGEIYLAQDTRLNRKVAIKLLPERYTKDPERLRRFEQEAQAASALNHPNIITIFEIGEAGGRHFIATEYIEGQTLRRKMHTAPPETGEALDIAQQVVSALTAAHAAGIIHRDIKPENIMIRPDGYVKVLDFGLAKLTEKPPAANSPGPHQLSPPSAQAEPTGESEIPTTADLILDDEEQPPAEDPFATNPQGGAGGANETVPGVVMGTAQYMSPEQARGQRVDARADIFSFGIVLYEMIARRAPFTGVRIRDIIDSILNSDPPPLLNYQPDVPEVLEWVVAKALVKDREERYQTAKEMLNDLRRLRSRLGVEQELEKSRGPINAAFGATGGRDTLSGKSTEEFDLGTGPFFDTLTTRSLLNLKGALRSLISGAFGRRQYVALSLALSAAFGFGFYYLIKLKWDPAPPFQSMQVRRFTTSGKSTRAAVSPDGKYVVHVLSEAGKQSLLVRQVAESNNIEIVPPAEVTYQGLTFSRDGAHVFYVVQRQNNPIRALYQVPALGGVPRKVMEDVDSPVAISPDGERLAFVRRYRGQNEDALIIADLDGGNERKLASRKGAEFFWTGGPAWSPDGKIIATAAGSNTGVRHMYLAEINVEDGKEKPVSMRRWSAVGRVSWARGGSPAGRGLIFTAVERGSTLGQIWFLPYPNGVAQKITNDLNDYRDLSLTDDSTALITAQSEAHVNVWISTANDRSNIGRDLQITDGVGQYNGVGGLTWTPERRLVYVSRASGSQDIWLMDQDGKNQKQLTTIETRIDRYPAVTPDGRYIVFVSTRTGNSNIYRYDMASGEQKQLTAGLSEEFPEVSADGKWVIYASTESIKHTLWKVPIDGGQPTQLTDKLSTWPDISPDGQKIACWYRADPGANWQIAIIPITGGPITGGPITGGNPEKVFDVPPNTDTPIPIRWMPDQSGITFIATPNGVSNVWYQPLKGGAPHKLTDFASDRIFWFDWSRDGKQLACSRGKILNDIVLITESKP
ncbi:MAG TPA: protein kinase [Blastocatellia bacterium]|nr:protein kinase [Blastocatellia bacterium]